MVTLLKQQLNAGDVIEVRTNELADDDTMTVLVLLATDEFLVLDPCNDSTPFVVTRDELIDFRRFDADDMLADF